ncbi:MAG: hypothetical protein L6420_11215 [Elusimicrobia bacterium]|nr:hypothetical protein [Elusimicrobiota bacterium]
MSRERGEAEARQDELIEIRSVRQSQNSTTNGRGIWMNRSMDAWQQQQNSLAGNTAHKVTTKK